jgi:hypothetical protein
LDGTAALPASASEVAIVPLTQSLEGLAGAADHVSAAYAALESCRFSTANAARDAVAAGTIGLELGNARIEAERRSFLHDLAAAVALSDRIQGRASVALRAADRLIAAAPASLEGITSAVTAPVRANHAFFAVEAAELYLRPDPRSPIVAQIRKGLRVESDDRDGNTVWLPVVLNDGSVAWVERSHLRTAPQNPSSLHVASREAAGRATSGDPVVALGLAARLTLPMKDDALERRLIGGAEAAEFAFALIPPAGAGRVASLAVSP